MVLAEIPYDREEVNYDEDGPARDRLFAINPLGQVPTLVMPAGSIMTETAAIVLYIDELVPAAGLMPPPGEPARRAALRWLAFFIAAIYPTFSYGDDPKKWVGEEAADRLRASTNEHRQRLWRQLEGAAVGPWFLGATRSALDLYIAVATHWRPRREWFAVSCPKLSAIATKLDADPQLRELWEREFDVDPDTQATIPVL
ncbi:glutathione S-transferase [soil metagenome]